MRQILTNSILERDASLSPEIKISPEINVNIPEKSENILLTGATGFLGIFLLHSLLTKTQAKIYCLVRSKDNIPGIDRLKQWLQQYHLNENIDLERIIAVDGDLEQPILGMSEAEYKRLCCEIDTIYHNGAMVNYVFPYQILKKANVSSTEEILKFAVQKRLKAVNYISSMFVYSSKDYADKEIITEEDCPIHGAEINMGYGQSKWVAEKMVRTASERGIPASIHRVGRISGDTSYGACQTKDFFWGIIRTCFCVGYWPDLDIHINISPVDYVSNTIATISSNKESYGKVYNIISPRAVSLEEVFGMLSESGHNLERLAFDKWKVKVSEYCKNSVDSSHELLLKTLEQLDLSNLNRKYDMKNTLYYLNKASESCPLINTKLMDTYLNYFVGIGFIKV